MVQTVPQLYSNGVALDGDADKLGCLRDSSDLISDLIGNTDALRQRVRDDGYLYLPGYLDRDDVMDVRRVVTNRLAAGGHLDTTHDPIEAVATPNYDKKFMPEVAIENEPLHKLLYTGRMMELFRRLLGGEVRHYDFTWFRAIAPGKGTAPHCDSVYMNRGTTNLYTAWTPMGDISFEMGGLMLLEGSINNRRLRDTYCRTDVDSYCANRDGKAGLDSWGKGNAGVLSRDPAQLRHSLVGRWLTNEFRAGDVLVFSIFMVHASLDNHSNRIRLSSDSRYQLAGDAVDDRWIGENPIGHSQAGKRGRIC